MMVRVVCAGLLVLAAGTPAFSAPKDVVILWSDAVLDAVRDTRTPPPRATRAFAMMHVAMFDAVNGIVQEYEPYAVDFRVTAPPRHATPEASAAEAAYTVLAGLYPDRERKLNALRRRTGKAKKRELEASQQWGRLCGEAILALRENDGSNDVVPYFPVIDCGRWQPTPPNFAPALLPQWPYVVPFAMERGDQFRSPPPPDCTSVEYALAFMEVKELGAVNSTSRTRDETEIAFFWEDGPGSVTPPGRWQFIAQELAVRFELSLVDRTRMFALLSITQADAAIVSWDSKYFHDHWRPVTAIPLADMDGNDLTDVDPDWFPLLPTPPFPAYTSGHSTFSGSSAELLELFFGDDSIPLTVRTPKPTIWPMIASSVRRYSSLREAAEEAGQSRIYGGIHWQYDNTAGLESGRELAQYVIANFLLPLD
jgi:hypothetical protein